MKHTTFLMSDSHEFGHTWTARCRACAWTDPRLKLEAACEAALAHEAEMAEKGLTQPTECGLLNL